MAHVADTDEHDGMPSLPEAPWDVPSNLVPLWHVLLRVYGRKPSSKALHYWNEALEQKNDARVFLRRLTASKPFLENKNVQTHNPPGHFFSPVVNPDEVRGYVEANRRAGPLDLGGIEFPLEEMAQFWQANRDFISKTPFTENKTSENRYYYSGGPYNYGDAITLRAMIGHFRPRRVVEIGSGYSSACMLDASEQAGLSEFHLTCIEPYPTRLKSILRPGDETKVTIHERGVQGMPLDVFASLEPNDILFIDSTHVMKTGSDVHYELFYILPVLKPGVVIHIHDCRFPFEYSDKQIFEKNYSWNEVYAVRALLMYSTRFKVFFSGSLFAQEKTDLVKEVAPIFLRNPGSALWLKVT